MPYRPTYGEIFRPATSYVGAIVPTSIASGFIGTCLLISYFLISNLPDTLPNSLGNVIVGLMGLGVTLAVATLGAAFVVAFYVVLFGLPVALILRANLRHHEGLFLACITAVLAAFVASHWFRGWPNVISGGAHLGAFTATLCFALPAGIIYRNMIIAMLDEQELD